MSFFSFIEIKNNKQFFNYSVGLKFPSSSNKFFVFRFEVSNLLLQFGQFSVEKRRVEIVFGFRMCQLGFGEWSKVVHRCRRHRRRRRRGRFPAGTTVRLENIQKGFLMSF